jgi:hypothetical protein
MKPPFWEVTISRRAVAGEEPTIESVNCFDDRIAAQEYATRALREDATARIVVRHVEAIAPLSEVSRWSNWAVEAKPRQPEPCGSQFRLTS